jgi:hypothetical protein
MSSSSTSREDHKAQHKSRHMMNMTPNGPGTEAWNRKIQGPEQKMLKLTRPGAISKLWRRQCQGPTCRREQVNYLPRRIGEWDGAETGLGQSAQAGRPGLFWARFTTPFDLGAPLYISSTFVGRHIHPFTREQPTQSRNTERKLMTATSPRIA